MNNNKLDNLKLRLGQLLSDIENFRFSPIRSTGKYDKDESKEFLVCVADLVHLMQTSETTSFILQNLIDIYERLPNSEQVKVLNANFSDAFIPLASEIICLPKWKSFCRTKDGQNSYVNPLEKTGKTDRFNMIKSAVFVSDLSKFRDFRGNTIDQVDTIREILVDSRYGLNGILDKYFAFDKDSFPKFSQKLSECFGKANLTVNKLKELFEYNPRFDAYNSLIEILSIYRNVHPNPNQTPEFVGNFSYYFSVENGLTPQEVKQLQKHATKIVRVIENNLNLSVIKKQLVSRFKAMCELYDIDELVTAIKKSSHPEKTLQKYWEKFAFLNNYYPISEAQLGSGRLDSLITSDVEAAFLSEIKQIGFSTQKINLKFLIKGAAVQADAYKRKLEGFPNLDKNVYVLLFTNFPVSVEKDEVEKSGIHFHLEVIQISNEPDSKKTPVKLNIQDIVYE